MRVVTNKRVRAAKDAAARIVAAANNGGEYEREKLGLSRREIAAFGFGIMTGARHVADEDPGPNAGEFEIAFAGLLALRDMLNDVMKEMV